MSSCFKGSKRHIFASVSKTSTLLLLRLQLRLLQVLLLLLLLSAQPPMWPMHCGKLVLDNLDNSMDLGDGDVFTQSTVKSFCLIHLMCSLWLTAGYLAKVMVDTRMIRSVGARAQCLITFKYII